MDDNLHNSSFIIPDYAKSDCLPGSFARMTFVDKGTAGHMTVFVSSGPPFGGLFYW
jgi:hypothetical protein